MLMELSLGCRRVPCCHREGGHPGKKGKECKISDSPKAEAQKQAEGHEGIRGDLQGVRMRVHLTIFTDVPFSPAGGCLLLLFLTRHQTEEGQHSPVDRKGEATCTHSEEEEDVIEARSGGQSPWTTSPNGGRDATQLQQEKGRPRLRRLASTPETTFDSQNSRRCFQTG